MFDDHLDKVSRAVEVACEEAGHKRMSEMVRLVDARDISLALHKAAPGVGGGALVKQTGQWLGKAIEAMLLTAPDPPDDSPLA